MRRILFMIAGFMTLPFMAFSQNRAYVNEYLNIGVGGRALAMGGANAATTSDVFAANWNPAGLTQVNSFMDIGLMHAEYFAGIFKYDYAGLAMPLKDSNRVLALNFIRFGTDNIPYTLDYVQPDGTFDDSKLSSFSAGDYALTFSYAQKLKLFKPESSWHASIGGNGKILYRNVGKMANAWGFGLDAGLQVRNKSWYFGLMLKDITTTYTAWSFHLTDHEKQVFESTGNEIPVKSYEVMFPRFNFGVGHNFLKPDNNFQLTAELGFDITTDGRRGNIVSSELLSVDPKLGLEVSYKDMIFLRGGIGNFQRVMDNSDTLNTDKYTLFQPSVGVGFKLKNIAVDYAFTSLQMQSNPLMSHFISLRINLNHPKPTNNETKEIL